MPSKEKVIVDPAFRRMDEIFDPSDLNRLRGMAEVVWARDDPMPWEQFERIKHEVFAVVSARCELGPLEEMPKLRAVLEVGGRHPSPDRFDYRTCFARGIRVLSCAPAFGPMVAEMALGMALATTRDIVEGHTAFREGNEKYLHEGNVGTFTLFGRKVGLIGFGGLARSLKPLLDPFHCEILAYDPWLTATYLRNQGATPAGLEELLAASDVIFVLAIPTPSNEAMLNRSLLGLIRPHAALVLISRSHLVDFDALTDLLHQRKFKAAIDVFPEEPLPPDHPIRKAPGVILSGHRAGSVERDLKNIGRMAVNDLEAMMNGLPPTEMQVAQPEIIQRFR